MGGLVISFPTHAIPSSTWGWGRMEEMSHFDPRPLPEKMKDSIMCLLTMSG